MRHFRREIPELMAVARLVLLLPFLLIALVPQGYMPSVENDGTFTVTLCTGDGLRTVTLDAYGNEVPDAPDDQDEGAASLCIFAGLSQVAVFQRVPDLPAVTSEPVRQTGILPVGLPGAVLTGRLGARAPPQLL